MAAVTTGLGASRAANRNNRKVLHDTTDVASEPLLPVKENKLFTYELPIDSSPSLVKGWTLPGIGLLTLIFQTLISILSLLDSAIQYLRNPLLVLVILAFVYGHFSDVYPHEDIVVGNVSTITFTTTLTETMTETTTVFPSLSPRLNLSLSLSSATVTERLVKESDSVRDVMEGIELPTFTVSQMLSVESVLKTEGSSVTSGLPLSQATTEVDQSSISSSKKSLGFVETNVNTSTSSSKASTRVRVSSPERGGPNRSKVLKKRMYE